MSQPTLKPKRLLFVSFNDILLGRLAENCFTAEAQKMELNWEAGFGTLATETKSAYAQQFTEAIGDSSSTIVEPITINDLDQRDLVVLLETSGGECSEFKKRFSKWHGEIENWKITDAIDPVEHVKSHVSKLVVKLIFKGGKRTPLAPQAPSPDTAGSSKPSQAGTAKVSLDAKGRKGKKVTTVSSLTLNDEELEKLAAELKQLCGCGGTVKDGIIEIQGDQRDRILSELKKRGYKAKRSGG